MKRVICISLGLMLLVATPAQARTFADLQTDLAAAPGRIVQAFSTWHPLADARAALRRGVVSWEESAFLVSETTALLWGRLALGSIEVAESADRAAAAFIRDAFSKPPPSTSASTPPPPAPSQRGETAPVGDDTWISDVEHLFEQNQSSP